MLSMRRVPLWAGAGIALSLLLASACQQDQTTEPTVTGVAVAKGGGGGGGPTIDQAVPPGAPQDTTLDVQVLGSGFDDGSVAEFTLDGVATPKVHTNATQYVSRSELVANITITLDADTTLYDVEVMTRRGKKGVGADLFRVRKKGEDASLYALNDLSQNHRPHKKDCSLCSGYAHDISEADGGMLYVVGWIDLPMQSPTIAVVWTSIREQIGEVDPVELETGFQISFASGISDDHRLIVGDAYTQFAPSDPGVPVAWEPDGSGGWQTGFQLPGTYEHGQAIDANNLGMIVGWVTSGPDTAAAVWSSPTAPPDYLVVDGFQSAAHGLNNHGDVVGQIGNGPAGKAALWTGGTYCDLHPAGASESNTIRIEDRDVAGRVLIAGQVSMQPAIWTVDVAACGPSGGGFTVQMVNIAGSEGRVLDIVRVAGGWEAVGDQVLDVRQPLIWLGSGASSELLYDDPGYAFTMNSDGDIAGSRRVREGLWQPVVWIRR